ncbi:hypothetical protein MJ1_0375 [Nanobdella aerobiophila]|uniref:Uncharacterized protein n=1 Tax=Nanobdella aerobiophila TaxID=2586965 RepID=A0A915SFP5_9ARCH|nr:hypothetical protein [Nanobdella aerobiophila]BBL45539.1 hypothetical protein MJ1_0375 [Nanobdella aerobiophila]
MNKKKLISLFGGLVGGLISYIAFSHHNFEYGNNVLRSNNSQIYTLYLNSGNFTEGLLKLDKIISNTSKENITIFNEGLNTNETEILSIVEKIIESKYKNIDIVIKTDIVNSSTYIFWEVPWGPHNGTYKNLDTFLSNNSDITQGVVIAFDYNYNYSLQMLKTIYEADTINKSIYVNLFVTAGNRDLISTLNQEQYNYLIETLKYINNISDGGNNIVIGFSEMDNLNITYLASLYNIIHEYLPNAKLFYYSDLGHSNRPMELYRELKDIYNIKLNMIGLEMYTTYMYKDGVIYIPNSSTDDQYNILENYIEFSKDNNVQFFIGELGFRDGDKYGYIDSGSISPIGSLNNYRITIDFYKDIIKQLNKDGIDTVGIWDYNGANGDPFGLCRNQFLPSLIKFIINSR